MGCIHIHPRNLGLRRAEHRAEEGKCKDPAEWVEAPRNMGDVGGSWEDLWRVEKNLLPDRIHPGSLLVGMGMFFMSV